MKRTALALVLVTAAGSAGWAHGPGHRHSHGGHSQAAHPAGEPGDPRRPSRIVQIAMRETEDGRMLFSPATLSVKRGEQVRFVLRNVGKIEHEFVLDSVEGNAEHKAAMASNPTMEHHDPNAAKVAAGKSGELVWRFTTRGEFEFACLIPGHYEAGMKGIVTVE